MNFSEVKFYENYLTLDFHTNNIISRRVCVPIKMAFKTVKRLLRGTIMGLGIFTKKYNLTNIFQAIKYNFPLNKLFINKLQYFPFPKTSVFQCFSLHMGRVL